MSRIFSSAEPGPQLTWTAMAGDDKNTNAADIRKLRRSDVPSSSDDELAEMIAKRLGALIG